MPNSLKTPYVSPQNLSLYLSEIRKIPLLEPEVEFTLAKRWKVHADPEAAQQLIASHLRLVAKIAKRFDGYGFPLDELISEGNNGLMTAVERFDPERGFRLATYAMNLIANKIKLYIPLNLSVVKPPSSSKQRKAFYNLGRLLAERQDYFGGELSHEIAAAIGKEISVSAAVVISARRRMGGDLSLNERVRGGEYNEEGSEREDSLADEAPSPEDNLVASRDRKIMNERRRLFKEALATLDDRERRVLVGRRLREEPITLEVFSRELEISKERVRQIEGIAYEKVQKAIRRAILKAKFKAGDEELQARPTRIEDVPPQQATDEKSLAIVLQIPRLPAPLNRRSADLEIAA